MSSVLLDDGRTYTPASAKAIRQEWVEREMNARASEYSDLKSLSLFCGTYNVNAKKEDGSLDDWIGAAQGQEWADLYVIGFQEIVDLNAMNVAIDGSKTASRSQFWIDKIAESLRKNKIGDRYVLVAQRALVGLLLCVFAKESLTKSISDIRTASTAVGVMGVMGNKGGVSCRFSVYDSSVCFVCSHLAAHRGNVAGRNSDYNNIIEKTMFSSNEEGAGAGANGINGIDDDQTFVVRPLRGHEHAKRMDLAITDHDIVFWLGDLNYRIDESLSTSQVFELIKSNRLKDLAAQDQLSKVRSSGTAFQEFLEGDISSFAPTYKYAPGTTIYDERNPNKIRAPAWCDRVLWRARPSAATTSGGSVRKGAENEASDMSTQAVQLSYRAVPSLQSSDHKPVRADFKLRCVRYLPDKEQATYRQLEAAIAKYGPDIRALQAILGIHVSGPASAPGAAADGIASKRDDVTASQNVSIRASSLQQGRAPLPVPEVTLNEQLLEFPMARYHNFSSRKLIVTNTGNTLAHWRVVSKLENSPLRLCKRWLHLSQTRGLLFPGESADIGVHCFVDTLTAHRLNSGKEGLEDLLVLRVEGGIDHYVAIAGHYHRSSFGMSLQELVVTPAPAVQTLLPPARVPETMPTPQQGHHTESPGSGGDEGGDLLSFVSPGDGGGGGESGTGAGAAVPPPPLAATPSGGTPSATLSSSPPPPAGVSRMSIPKELWRLVDNLWSAGAGGALRERDLFALQDTHVLSRDIVMEVAGIREALDDGSDLPSCSPHSIVATLASFLMALPKPLLPPELCPHTHVDASDLRPWCRAFLQSLPALNYNAFVYVMSFLREVLSQRNYNRANPTILATFCVDTMTAFSGPFRAKQQLNFYHTLAAGLAHRASSSVANIDVDEGSAGWSGPAGVSLADSHGHSNLVFSGAGASAGAAAARVDEVLEGRRRALGAVIEYMLTTSAGGI